MKQADIKQKAKEIAKALEEETYGPRVLIERIIRHLGIDLVETTLKETLDIQSKGGLLIKDGSRKRSTGGVFFHLVKSSLSPEENERFFPNPQQRKKKKKAMQAAQSAQDDTVTPVENMTNQAGTTEADEVQELKALAKTFKPTSVESEKLKKLKTAAATLRQRLTAMETQGQKGVKMTQKLLDNTERKIARLQQA